MSEQTNKERFVTVYTEQLREHYKNDTLWHQHLKGTIEELAVRMTDGLPLGRANKDSVPIKNTCKVLGIKHTYKALKEFLQ